tara:strand:- start:1112 stop:1213 length:102 start_codon:yes stop_codon:yes gene_type:complete
MGENSGDNIQILHKIVEEESLPSASKEQSGNQE